MIHWGVVAVVQMGQLARYTMALIPMGRTKKNPPALGSLSDKL
jgi:hypothetical protein